MDEMAQILVDSLPNQHPREKVIALIMNTLLFYKENPRSMYEGKSYYQHPKNAEQKCAVGRFIQPGQYDPEIEPKFTKQIKDRLHPAIQQLVEDGDLSIMAQLHDHDQYWKGNQISVDGLMYLGYTYGFNSGELYAVLSVYKD